MKKHIQIVISLILLVGIMMVTLATAQAVEARYTGTTSLSSTLSISSAGAAKCSGDAELRDGYTATLKVELQQDGVTIKTWTSSGSGDISAGGTYYVQSGHSYVVKTTATVYDSSNRWVESPYKNSVTRSY